MSWAGPPPPETDVPEGCAPAAEAFAPVFPADPMAPEADAPWEAAVSELVVAMAACWSGGAAAAVQIKYAVNGCWFRSIAVSSGRHQSLSFVRHVGFETCSYNSPHTPLFLTLACCPTLSKREPKVYALSTHITTLSLHEQARQMVV